MTSSPVRADTSTGDAATLSWEGPVPVRQVLDHVRPAYGGDTWEDAFTFLHATASEAKVIAELTASASTGFTAPIRVSFDDEDGCWRLGNGMHRMATAVALGHDHIECTTDGHPDDDAVEFVEVRFQLPGDWPVDTDLDAMDYACGWLRSFPLPDGTWVESDMFTSHGDVLEGLWVCPHAQSETLVAQLVTRSAAFTLTGVRCVTGAELDAEYEAEFGSE